MSADTSVESQPDTSIGGIERWVPGIKTLRTYRAEWFRYDLLAGLSVAAVAVPIGIAYAPLAGLPPVNGLYASILPLVAYTLFGSSRQLIIGPDAAATALVGSTLAMFAAGGTEHLVDVSMVLAVFTGIYCIIGGVARLGFIVNFLSKPILMGYLNGIALTIIAGQLGKVFGYSLARQGFFRTFYEFVSKLGQTNVTALIIGLSAFILLRMLKRINPILPAPLVAVILGILATYWFRLSGYGVALVGYVPAGLPPVRIPSVSVAEVYTLAAAALGITLVSYSSDVATATGFASKNRYRIDANQEFTAMGFANIAAGISQGFVVCGADSRTAVSDSMGGKTQMTGIFAALTITAVLMFLTGPISYLPVPVLGAVLISAAIGLFNLNALRMLHRVSPPEFYLSLLTTLGVITLGLLPGILIAVNLALLKLLSQTSHPHDAILGRAKGHDVYQDVTEYPDNEIIPGLVIYRFDSAVVFFNADYFRNRIRDIVANTKPGPEWFLLDAEPINSIDVTGAVTLDEIRAEMESQGIVMAVARVKGQPKLMLNKAGVLDRIGSERIFSSIREGAAAFLLHKHPQQ